MTSGPTVYADHHATTPLRPEALEAMLPFLTGLTGNPSSAHAAGRSAREAVEKARAGVAEALGAASPAEIVFTSGGSEADNLAVRGGALARRERDPGRSTVVISRAEHAAVHEAAHDLTCAGFRLHELPVDADGLPSTGALESALGPDIALVSLVLANNETGAVNQELPRMARLAHERGAVVHTDAVQAAGKIPVDVQALGVDLLALAAHKLGGPKGVGALWVRAGVRVHPQLAGGGQERGRRSGTENVAGIVGLAAALRSATLELASEGRRVRALRDRFEAGVLARLPDVTVNGRRCESTVRLPTVSSLVFAGADAEALLIALDLEGIAVSAGSACSAGTAKLSRILLALGLPAAEVRSTLRFSFGRTTTEDDIDRLLSTLPPLVEQARRALREPA